MKKQFLLYSILLIVLNGFPQQQFIHTATKGNNGCNGDCTLLDIPELNNNPNAILLATSVDEKGATPNPHAIGVYYFKSQWNILNLDQKPIPAGAKFNVEYVANPDPSHFQYTVTSENLRRDGSAFIDHPLLNNNPSAKFSYLLNWIAESQRGATNRELTSIQYNTDAGKWSISNTNNKPLFAKVVYNIIVSSDNKVFTPPTVSNAVEIKELTITPTAPSASGTLSQMFMTTWADGKKLPGDNSLTGHLDQAQLFSFEMGATNFSTGKKTYEPITIKTRTGFPSTISFFNAFIKNQSMVITIETYTTASTGKQYTNYLINLEGAHIVGFKQLYEELGLHIGPINGTQKEVYNEIKIMFTKIEFVKDGVSVVDNL